MTAGNPYYAMQDALAVQHERPSASLGNVGGVGKPILSADRMYASKQAPFLITETNAGAIGGSATDFPGVRGDGGRRRGRSSLAARR